MKVKMILPALTEAKSPFWRPIKFYHLLPMLETILAGFGRYPARQQGQTFLEAGLSYSKPMNL